MLKQVFTGIMLALVLLAAAPVDAVGESVTPLDLSTAVIVVRQSEPVQAQVAKMLREEVEERTGLALRVIDADEVAIEMSAANKPAVIKSGSEFLYVLMPVDLG